MVFLTGQEQEWLRTNYPLLKYEEQAGFITGSVAFQLRFNERTIKDIYRVKIDLSCMTNRMAIPKVFNTDGRIKRIAEKKGIELAELHVNPDSSLCMILDIKITSHYLDGFSIQHFMKHLCEHLYWISYRDRYNEEPWKAEKHGNAAMVEYVIENVEEILGDKAKLEKLRNLYKRKFNKGIAKSKLARLIGDPKFVTNLLKP